MRFRKNEFTVHISSQSETTVKAFAESALKAIEAK
jgi:lactate dehydrogenase-like 2-hydroxyacid dehydrogenase